MLYVLKQSKNNSRKLRTNVSRGTVPRGKNVESLLRHMTLKCYRERVNGVQVTVSVLLLAFQQHKKRTIRECTLLFSVIK